MLHPRTSVLHHDRTGRRIEKGDILILSLKSSNGPSFGVVKKIFEDRISVLEIIPHECRISYHNLVIQKTAKTLVFNEILETTFGSQIEEVCEKRNIYFKGKDTAQNSNLILEEDDFSEIV